MPTFDRDDLLSLARSRSWPSLSIYLPTHRVGAQKDQDRIRLKNLVRDAQDRLVSGGMRSVDAEQTTAPVRELLDDETFWRDTADGLAVFVSPEMFRTMKLHSPIAERVVVGERFYLRSLVAAMRENHRFFALAVDRNGSRLFRGDGGSIHEVPLEGAPSSLADELKYDDVDGPSLQHVSVPAPGSGAGAVFHGHGGEKDTDKINLERYLRKVDAALVKATMAERGIPLVLLGVEYELSRYRALSAYPSIAPSQVNGATDELKVHEIHAKAIDALEPVFGATEASWVTELVEREGSSLAQHDPRAIADAAMEGRVKALFFDDGFDAPGDDGWDLIDLAVADTMLNGGDVHAFAGESPPIEGVAAVLRY